GMVSIKIWISNYQGNVLRSSYLAKIKRKAASKQVVVNFTLKKHWHRTRSVQNGQRVQFHRFSPWEKFLTNPYKRLLSGQEHRQSSMIFERRPAKYCKIGWDHSWKHNH